MIEDLKKLHGSPSWGAAQDAKSAWLATHRDPSASLEVRRQARGKFARLMRRCLAEAGVDVGASRIHPA